jgi:hypothetical protein
MAKKDAKEDAKEEKAEKRTFSLELTEKQYQELVEYADLRSLKLEEVDSAKPQKMRFV